MKKVFAKNTKMEKIFSQKSTQILFLIDVEATHHYHRLTTFRHPAGNQLVLIKLFDIVRM